MYAVVKTGGKQYRIAKGDILRVEKLEGKVGDQVTLKDVAMVSQEGEVQVGRAEDEEGRGAVRDGLAIHPG